MDAEDFGASFPDPPDGWEKYLWISRVAYLLTQVESSDRQRKSGFVRSFVVGALGDGEESKFVFEDIGSFPPLDLDEGVSAAEHIAQGGPEAISATLIAAVALSTGDGSRTPAETRKIRQIAQWFGAESPV